MGFIKRYVKKKRPSRRLDAARTGDVTVYYIPIWLCSKVTCRNNNNGKKKKKEKREFG